MPPRSKVRNDPHQLDLFALTFPNREAIDAIWPHGGEAVARVPAEDGRGTRNQGAAARDVAGGGGENRRGIQSISPSVDAPGPEATADPPVGLGDGSGEIHSPVRVLADSHEAVGQQANGHKTPLPVPEPLRNQSNYRITDADKIGFGSLKQKCHDNLVAIELLKQIEAETRTATEEEKRVLVRYVGWGGLPQVFDPGNEKWSKERDRLE